MKRTNALAPATAEMTVLHEMIRFRSHNFEMVAADLMLMAREASSVVQRLAYERLAARIVSEVSELNRLRPTAAMGHETGNHLIQKAP